MVCFLTENRNMFQWAEVVFLERWYRDIPDTTNDQVLLTSQLLSGKTGLNACA
ncbi:hypothetical protein DPMN_024746 [Dreissena polymorpha]|uniref:Uncharacterized protein n=1 Tax=Dreissena polymorpha TaxID=45954 RepID=A0A9D4RCY8_DREPO|nr:hypothetical protein DPMN_024746 [Dreissena polymorpha]